MTSEERHAARRQRRAEKREQKRIAANAQFDDFSRMTDLNRLRRAAKMSRAGVAGKASVQKYFMDELRNENATKRRLENGEDIREGFIEFDLYERGHARHIKAMHFRERVVQRCFCDEILIPVLTRSLVYDNGASLKGKGIHFAMFRVREQLHRYFRKHGTKGYILQTDFSRYFENIQHEPLRKLLERSFRDPKVIALAWDFITAFGDSSIGIGSQVSQIFAVSYASRADHYTREVARLGFSGRYMDDSYAIAENRDQLEALLEGCRKIWSDLGIVISEKKTHIIPLRRFTFLKVRYMLTDSGKVVMKPGKKSFTRMRRKLRAFRKMLDRGEMSMNQIEASYKSWYGYQQHFHAHRSLREMDKYFYSIFGVWITHRKRKRRKANDQHLHR